MPVFYFQMLVSCPKTCRLVGISYFTRIGTSALFGLVMPQMLCLLKDHAYVPQCSLNFNSQ